MCTHTRTHAHSHKHSGCVCGVLLLPAYRRIRQAPISPPAKWSPLTVKRWGLFLSRVGAECFTNKKKGEKKRTKERNPPFLTGCASTLNHSVQALKRLSAFNDTYRVHLVSAY